MKLIDDSAPALVEMDRDEIRQLLGCIRESLEALDDWEFQTRMGWTREEIEVLESNLLDLLEALPGGPTP